MHKSPTTAQASFIEKVTDRSACIGVIGLGYVGLPLILGFHSRDFRILGIDVDQEKIDALEAGESYIKHIPDDRIKGLQDRDRFAATTDFSRLPEADAILICVPTPLTRHLEPEMAYVVSTAEAMAPHLKAGHLIILESTTYPGTTRDLMVPILEKGSGFKADEDFFVAYSPEREDPGNPEFEAQTIPKVVGAAVPEALEMAKELYGTLVPKVVPVSSPEVAEAVKLTENIFRAVNIAMVNELKVIYGEMGIDVWEVIDAAKTKPFGFMPFYPGPGLGGHCIPIDPFYLTWKAREYGLSTRFIELAGQINRNMPLHVVNTLRDALSARQQAALTGARVLLVGIAYKKNVDDMRESPSLTLIDLLEERGAQTDYFDPYIPEIPQTREHANLAGRKSVPLDPDGLKSYDAVLIATDHDDVDYGMIVKHASLVVDTRNACARAGLSGGNVLKA
ncbi:MAG: nucleotide sugar dehydrogenase [Hyphomicrobiaceae bacterium]|nr:nucleotide sugar dehydrogenase [Hyphomicrobiaceae bacterium]